MSCQPSLGGFQNARVFGAVIAEHNVRPTDIKPAAFFDAGHGFEPRFHQRRQAADAAGPVRQRRVDGEHGRRLGHAVAFQNAHAEAIHIELPCAVLDRFGTGQHQTHTREVIGVGGTRIARQERVGAKQDGRVRAVNEFGNDAVVQGRRVQEHGDAADQRHQQSGRQAERVEHRQRVEHLVRTVAGHTRQALRAVGQQVAMRQHYALGRALRTRGEQDCGRRVGIDLDLRFAAGQKAFDLVRERDGRADIFEIDNTCAAFDRLRSGFPDVPSR